MAKHYIAGILKYAPEFSLITNQYVNSYKRLVSASEVPSHLSWARTSRSTLLRVPGYRPHRPDACRIELRSPDPAANPYLAFAVMLAAGLAGIEEGLEPIAPVESSDSFNGKADNAAESVGVLPMNLGDAVDKFEGSQLMRDVLGEHIHSYLVQTKRAEWMSYLRRVSEWELDRYLAVL
jgi:glutamine synthetase